LLYNEKTATDIVSITVCRGNTQHWRIAFRNTLRQHLFILVQPYGRLVLKSNFDLERKGYLI